MKYVEKHNKHNNVYSCRFNVVIVKLQMLGIGRCYTNRRRQNQ